MDFRTCTQAHLHRFHIPLTVELEKYLTTNDSEKVPPELHPDVGEKHL